MREHNSYGEPIINIREISYYIVSKWRLVLIAMMFFGVLFGLYKYISDVSTVNEQAEHEGEVKIESVEEYIDSLEIEDSTKQKLVETLSIIEKYDESYKQMAVYMQNSVWMNLDANKVPTYTLKFYVDNHLTIEYPNFYANDNSQAIINALANSLYDQEMQMQMKEIIGEESIDYLKEIIDWESGNIQNGNFVINVRYYNEDEAQKISQLVKTRINEYSKSLEDVFGSFDVALSSESFAICSNSSILDKQRANVVNMSNIIDAIAKVENSLEQEEKEIYRKIVTFNSQETEEKEITKPILSKKYLLLGMIFGALLIVFFEICRYLFSGKMSCVDNIEQAGLYVFGVLNDCDDKKKKFAFVDRFIAKLFGKIDMKTEDKLEIIVAAVKCRVIGSGAKNIFIAGCELDEQALAIVEKLSNTLKDNDINVEWTRNFLQVVESYQKLSKADGVIFVEKLRYSKRLDFLKQVELCNKQKVDILGVVVQETIA